MVAVEPKIRCRQIAEADVAAVAALLARGFPNHSAEVWRNALNQLGKREPPSGLPKYGYLLDRAGVPVGAILLICSMVRSDGAIGPRCNLSSWYVEPAYRAYGALLSSRALSHKGVTYVNISPAPHTRPIIEAQGFSRYSDGIFIGVPMLNALWSGERTKVLPARNGAIVGLDASEQQILSQHAELGCISLVCESSEGVHPFVFRPRLVWNTIPCAQLVYCRELAEFVRYAGPIGRFLAWRGKPFVIVDANAPIPGLIGHYRRGSMPKYFKGPQRPRLGDLAYTECAVMGI